MTIAKAKDDANLCLLTKEESKYKLALRKNTFVSQMNLSSSTLNLYMMKPLNNKAF